LARSVGLNLMREVRAAIDVGRVDVWRAQLDSDRSRGIDG